MKTERLFLAGPSMFCVATALMLVAPFAAAQEVKAPRPELPTSGLANIPLSATPADNQVLAPAMSPGREEVTSDDEELIYEPLQVGDATQGLLALQSSGEISSTTPRPIAGVVANRSYERYLKSFDFPIPERMTSSVKSTNGGNGSAGK